MQALDPNTGRLVEFIPGATDNPAFPLLGGEGLVVYAAEIVNESRTSLGCPAWQLRAGINMVGSLCAPAGTSAYSLLTEPRRRGQRRQPLRLRSPERALPHPAFSDDNEPTGGDFPIVNGNGYLFFMRIDLPAFRAW